MPSQKNIDQLEILKTKLSFAKAVVFADYHGLSVAAQRELRQKVKAAAGEFSVAKNTLLKLAMKHLLRGDRMDSSEVEKVLVGPTALLIATEDEIGPLKALVEFARDHDLPKVKAGIMLAPRSPAQPGEVGEDRILTPEEISDLAKLPGRLDLQAKLVGVLNAPISGLTNVLQGNLRKLVGVLNAIKDNKPNGKMDH